MFGILVNLCRSRLRSRRSEYFQDFLGGTAIAGFRLQGWAPSAEAIFEVRELHRLVAEAIATLPSQQREAVSLHYLKGLRLSEIASLTGSPIGTVKAPSQRSRRAPGFVAFKDRPDSGQVVDGRPNMIEVIVQDVVVRSPKNEPAKWLAVKDYKLGLLRVILLRERIGERILPIWVGPIEGDIIGMLLEHLEFPRPTTFDLTTRLLAVGHIKIQKVAVTSLREKTYIGTIWVSANDEIHEVDARPSDGIALALQAGAPIFVDPEVFRSADLLSPEHELEQLEETQRKLEREGTMAPDPRPMEWKSFRSLPREEIVAPTGERLRKGASPE
jgi:uncharacterized protein